MASGQDGLTAQVQSVALEAAEKRGELRLQLLLDSLTDFALFMLDPDGVVMSWSAGAERLKGYRAAEVVGQHFSCFYTQEDIARGHPAFELAQAAARGKYEEDGWRIRKDGTRLFVHVLISAIRDPHGRLTGFAKFTRDVSAKQKLDAALATQARILDMANDAILVRDLEDRVTYWNEAAGRMYGWSATEAVGRVTHELLQTRFSKELPLILEELRGSGRWDGELDHTCKDGTTLLVESRWTAMRDMDGRPAGVIEVNHDVTERERLAQALKSTNQALRRALDTRDAFLAMMSHELRTPLNGIIGFSELLHRGKPGPLNDQQREFIGDVLASGHHLLALINDILDLSKIGAGKMVFHEHQFNVADAVRHACGLVQPLAEKKELTVRQNLTDAPHTARLDEVRFRQVLFNLLSNAIKFTEPGGSVDISVRRIGDGRMQVVIRDTGIGIAPENMHRLFRTFEQLDDRSNRSYKGTGLGLALTRSLVEMQGGSVVAQSAQGVGSVFTVDMPIGV